MWLSIVSPAPHYPGNSQDLAGTYPRIYRILCPRRPGPTLGLCGEIFLSKGSEIYYPGMSTYAGTLIKGARGYGAGTYRGIYKNPPAVPGCTRSCTLDITKYKIESPGKSPLSPGSGGLDYN